MKKYAIALNERTKFHRLILDGICDFAQSYDDLLIVPFCTDNPQTAKNCLGQWKPDGLIGCSDAIAALDLENVLGPSGIQVVTVGMSRMERYKHIEPNHRITAEQLMTHLMRNGHRTLAYLGGDTASLQSIEDFCRETGTVIQKHRASASLQDVAMNLVQGAAEIDAWLQSLPHHSAVITENAALGAFTVQAARRLNLQIPIDLSVISLEDQPFCNLPVWDLSAVQVSYREIGFQAIKHLRSIVEGTNDASDQLISIDATTIQARGSTLIPDIDFDVSRALKFIEHNACRGINVSDVIATLRMSRVTFERRFRESTGKTPAEHIRNIRLDRACKYLVETDESIARIGQLCGFDNLANFSAFFKSARGISPRHFRDTQRINTIGSCTMMPGSSSDELAE